jgi:uncharacterized metal-binding protein YceD (DUF177 family)
MKESHGHFIGAVPVEDIPEEGISLTFADMPGILSDVDDCEAEGPVSGGGFLRRVDGYVHLNGYLRGTFSLFCDRCLEKYSRHIEASFSYVLAPEESADTGSESVNSEDMEISFFDGMEVPIKEIFREQILLQLPMRNLCYGGCKGLCPGCGVNLNNAECRCRKEAVASPFSELGRLMTTKR